ncbi:MAG: 16S rRNA (guanine(966)-N(2))-methyltransferase RsmD [Chromatiales bacterium]|nr:16S rRNA (guanine(966)-N(2))-methyltransferase RsmD [Chromatiales bacterium]
MRIIGGDWRGRRLSFPDVAGLRPTPDRVRETLFNWLQGELAGRRCLDLFAGSGALGLEAASRGAAETVWVEQDRHAVQALRANLRELGHTAGRVEQADALRWLRQGAQPFDIVFIDPPYQAGLLSPAVGLLESGGWLAPGAWIYLEHDSHQARPVLPQNWQVIRDRRAGQVNYYLLQRQADSE